MAVTSVGPVVQHLFDLVGGDVVFEDVPKIPLGIVFQVPNDVDHRLAPERIQCCYILQRRNRGVKSSPVALSNSWR